MTLSAGKDTLIKKGGTPIAMSQEATTEITTVLFRITDADRRVLDPSISEVVRVNTSVQDPATYVIDHLLGTITFDSSQTGTTVDITSDYIPMHPELEARSISASFGRDLEDSTVIGDQSHKMTALLQNASIGLEKLSLAHVDLDPGGEVLRFVDMLRDGVPRVIELNLDGTNGYRAWMKAESDDPSFAPDALVTDSFNMIQDLQPGANRVWSYGVL